MRLCDHQRLKRVRVCGTIVAADVIAEGEEGYLHEVGPLLREQFLARGFLLRPWAIACMCCRPTALSGLS